MSLQAAARVTDPFGHTSALEGALVGLLVGAAVGAFIVATAGSGALLVVAAGAAVATAGGAGLMGEAIGQTIQGSPSGRIQTGSPDVLINGLGAAMVQIATGDCDHHDDGRQVATGVATVLVNGRPIARVGEKMDCSAVIQRGSPDVVIGGDSQPFLATTPEVPAAFNATLGAMAIGGTVVATGGMAAAYGAPAAVGALVGGAGGGYLGETGARAGAAALGFGPTGQAIAGAVGGLAGGAAGGAGGWRGGNALASDAAVARMPPDFQAEHAAAKAAGWTKPDDSTWWPPNNGGVGPPEAVTLPKDTPLDRYGSENGSFMSGGGDPFYDRAMTGPRPGDPSTYTTLQDTPVEQSQVAPWFDRPGGGTQYRLVDPRGSPEGYSVKNAIDDGYLSRGGSS